MKEKQNIENKEEELWQKLLPYLFEEPEEGFFKFIPIFSFILQILIFLILIFKK